MPISSAGIGSGLDVASIVSQLMAIESQPLINLQNKQALYETQISAYGQLRSSIASFQTAMDNLSTVASLDKSTATSSDVSIIKATATEGAEAGTYDIEVLRLAEAHKMSSAEALDTATFGGVASDSVSVQVGSDPEDKVTIDLSTAKTLTEIRDAINDDASNPGVTATIIAGDGSNQKLILTANNTGEASALNISYNGAVNLGMTTLNDIGGDLTLLNSEVNVDGYNITRATNSLDDIVTGVTFNLINADPGNTHSVKIQRDTSAIKNLVQDFSDAYDSLRAEISTQRSGQLRSDSALLTIERQLSNTLNTAATAGPFKYLTDAGLSMQQDGSMTFEAADLQAALEADFDGIAQLFGAEDDGYASRFYNLTESWLGTGGLLESRTDGLNARIEDVQDKQLNEQQSLIKIEARYNAQFSALDSLVSSLSSTSAYLSQQLDSLPGAFSFK